MVPTFQTALVLRSPSGACTTKLAGDLGVRLAAATISVASWTLSRGGRRGTASRTPAGSAAVAGLFLGTGELGFAKQGTKVDPGKGQGGEGLALHRAELLGGKNGGVEARLEAGLVDDFFFQAEDGIRVIGVTGVQTCALPI